MGLKWKFAALALVIRLAALGLLYDAPLQKDTVGDLTIARNVAAGWGFARDLDGDTVPEVSMRAPGYAAFLAACVRLTPDYGVAVARAVQLAAGAAATLAVFALTLRLVSVPAAAIAAAWYAVSPPLVVESVTPSGEGLLIPLLLVGCYLTVRGIEAGWRGAAAAGFVFGAAILTREIALGVAVCATLGALAARPFAMPRVARALVIVLACAAAVAPWGLWIFDVRARTAATARFLMPDIDRASAADVRAARSDVARRFQDELARRPDEPSADLTVLARVHYDFQESDPRREVPVLSASGGDASGVLAYPRAIVTRVVQNIRSAAAVVWLVPYENRAFEWLAADAPRLRDGWRSLLHPAGFAKLVLVGILLLFHVGVAAALVLGLRTPRAWPLLLPLAYCYIAPFIHTAPLNRFFLSALAVGPAAIGFAVVRALAGRDLPATAAASKVVYVLPHYDARSSEHFAHVVPFLEALGRRMPLAVVVERAHEAPPIPSAARIELLPPGRPLRRMWALAGVLVRLHRLGYRKIFVRISMPAGLVAGTVGRLLGIESYYWNSGQGKNTAPPWSAAPAALWRRARYELALAPFYLVTRLVDHFVTGPASMADYYAREYGVSRSKIVIFANDIDLEGFTKRLARRSRADVRRSLGLSDDEDLVLFVGRVSPLKGGEYVLPLVERVAPARPRARFVIVGDVHLPWFDAALAAHPLRERVMMLGKVPNADLAGLYGAADVFVLPSNSEGFPRVLLECMAAGLAFVAFDVGGVREIADPAHGPWIVRRGDIDAFSRAVLELLGDPDRRSELGRIARARVQLFATPAVVDLFAERIAAA